MRCLFAATWAFAFAANARAALHITEIAASNKNGITDEDGAHSDWIEVYNSGPGPVNLRGWHLTDDPLRVTRWEFPELVLNQGAYVVVFASGKDRSSSGNELHTDFSLASEGEYLALTNPEGLEADEFAPAYPPQIADVSWGVVPYQQLGTHAYFYRATPGAVNITSERASDPPVISPPSRTFTAGGVGPATMPPVVTLTAPQPGAQIFYTLDGSTPGTTSTLYTAPLLITSTTRLRAIAAAPTLRPSIVSGESYFELAADAVPFNSNLPLMIVDNFSGNRPTNGTEASWMIFERDGTTGRAGLTGVPAFATTAFIKVHGSSSASANKYSLSLEARNQAGGDRDFTVLGLPDDSDWILNAPYELDRALLRNPLMYALSNAAGRYAPRTRQVELFLNTDGGAITASDYFGIYSFTEKIKRSSSRVDVAEIGVMDNTPPAVTGGYLVKIDRADPGESGFGAAGQTLYYVDPDEPAITPQQESWLTWYLNSWRSAMVAPNFFDPLQGYAKWADTASFIDHHLLNVAAKNVDGLRLSAYFHKDRLGRFAAGPVWDFDRSLDSLDDRDNNFNSWRGETSDEGTDYFRYPWYNEMFADKNFWQSWIDRLEELRRGPLSTTAVQSLVDEMAAGISEAAPRNFTRWSDMPPRFGGWSGEVEHLRSWFASRLAWMDAQFTRPPAANTSGGPVPPDFLLTLTSPTLARPGAEIYYTTDGSDPRLFDDTTGQQLVTETFISSSHPVRVILPTSDIGTAWRSGNPFNDAAWWTGTQGVGYDEDPDYDAFIGLNLESPPAERRMRHVTQSCYIRMKFDAVATQIAPLEFLKLRVRCDDGMAVWLNGTKLPVSINEPANLVWNSGATTTTSDSAAKQWRDFTLPSPQQLLRTGENILAIHGLNRQLTSSDFLIQVELVGGYVPPDGPEISPTAIPWTGNLPMKQTTHLIARTYDPAGPFQPWPYAGDGSGQTPVGSHWSAPLKLSLLVGTVPAGTKNLTVAEIMYHPAALTAGEKAAGFNDRDDFEYLVLRNPSPQSVDLTGIHFTSGIDFKMPLGPKSVLAPGGRAILVRDPAAFALRALPGLNVIGKYKDKLSNAGETLTLNAADGSVIFSATWDDDASWPPRADGRGHSLVRRENGADPSQPAAWRDSLDLHGEAYAPGVMAFAHWQAIHFPNGGPDAAPESDPDLDGLSNAVEFHAVTSPLSPQDAASPVARRVTSAGQSCTEITLRHRRGAPLWLLESSADLSSWQSAGVAPDISPNSDGTETFTWCLPRTDARTCYRARVE
jgi:hypothetical protein